MGAMEVASSAANVLEQAEAAEMLTKGKLRALGRSGPVVASDES
jgi:hypothetical protein